MKKRSALIVKEADAMSRSEVLCDILDTEMKYLLFYSSNIKYSSIRQNHILASIIGARIAVVSITMLIHDSVCFNQSICIMLQSWIYLGCKVVLSCVIDNGCSTYVHILSRNEVQY